MLHFLPLFVLLLQQHIITVIKLQQPKYEKVVVQWNADYKSFSSVIKTPDEWQREWMSSECFTVVSQIP